MTDIATRPTLLRERAPEDAGVPAHRVEGVSKVTGRARYAADLTEAALGFNQDVAVLVTSSCASGRVHVDTAAALASAGVRAVVTHKNAPRLRKVTVLNGAEIGDLLPLQDDRLHYAGQCVAIVVADTLEQARAAALVVDLSYADAGESHAYTLEQGADRAKDVKTVGSATPGQTTVGKPEAAFEAAEVTVDLTFNTAPHHHNAIEPAAIVARFDDDGGLTAWLPTQFTYGDAIVLGQAFGYGLRDRMPRMVAQIVGGVSLDTKVRVISTLAGGAFGGKSGNIHLLLAPMAAKVTGRPVRLILSRPDTYSLMAFRGETRQRVRLGATLDGRLTALMHDAVLAKAKAGGFIEPVGEMSAKLYACANIRVHQQAVELDTNAPGWMRGPGVAAAQFAVEGAMDDLAHKLGIDPLELRLINHADTEPDTGKDWSSKSLKKCYSLAAERIGWSERTPGIGSMRDGRGLIGLGMATAIYPTRQMPAVARVTLRPDETAVVESAAHEIGQGMITAITQIAAEGLGLARSAVTLEWGDTAQPFGAMTVGSMTTLSVGAAVEEACAKVRKALWRSSAKDRASPLYGSTFEGVRFADGELLSPDGGETMAVALERVGESISRQAVTGRTMGRSRYARAAFGAVFARVVVDPDLGHVLVERLVGAFAGGRAINPVLVRSQLMGGMVWGLGHALVEETGIDPRFGRWMTDNLGEALVPVNADVTEIDTILVEEDDRRGHSLGVKGMGEIGTTGTAAAIANAIFHATGRRLVRTPIRIDQLMG